MGVGSGEVKAILRSALGTRMGTQASRIGRRGQTPVRLWQGRGGGSSDLAPRRRKGHYFAMANRMLRILCAAAVGMAALAGSGCQPAALKPDAVVVATDALICDVSPVKIADNVLSEDNAV